MYLYLLVCEGGYIYTGIAKDYKKRLLQYKGKAAGGAKFTRAHKPIKFGAVFKVENGKSAASLEWKIKKLSHKEKQDIIDGKFFLEDTKRII